MAGRKSLVKAYKAWFERLLVWRGVAVACGVILGLCVGYVLGSKYYSEVRGANREKLALLESLQANSALQQQQLVNLEMADKVNRMAQEKLRQRVTELQTQRMNLENELYVYKSLVEDDDSEVGLNLESLKIRAVEGDGNRFHYELVLRRRAELSQSVEATFSLDIEGELHGIADSIPFQEADPDLHEQAMSVSFKYFKIVKGEFLLPTSFKPKTVVLSLYESGRADSLIIKEIPWEPIFL